MKIIYNSEYAKNKCKDKQLELNIESILKCLRKILGNQIEVSEYNDDDFTCRIVVIRNMSNGLRSKITIGCSEDEEFNVKGVVNYLVTITQEQKKDSYELSETYVVNKYSVTKAYDSLRNKRTGITVKCREFNSNTYIYTITKGDTECSFLLKDPDIDVIFMLLEIKSLDLCTVYNVLKASNPRYVVDIVINFRKESDSITKKLTVEKDSLVSYEKSFIKDGVRTSFIYPNDDSCTVTTTQTLSVEDISTPTGADILGEINKVKQLLKKPQDDKS